jgi:hypothetical protein
MNAHLRRTSALLASTLLPAALAATVMATPAAAAPVPAAQAASPATGTAVTALRCRASMTNSRPRDYTTTGVRVRTVAHARVVTVAHYRTTDHRKAGRANGHGRATIWYNVSGATPGFRVTVDVRVSRGRRTGSCSTSFVPHR